MGSLIFGLLLFGVGYYIWPDFASLLINFDEEAISNLLDEDYISSGFKLGYFIAAGYYIAKSPFILLKNMRTKRNFRKTLEQEAENIGLKNYESLDYNELSTAIENKKEETNQKELEETAARELAEKERLEKELTKKFGKQDALRIIEGEIWLGMTKDMLIASRGEPLDTDETVLKSNTKSKFFYEPWFTRQKNMRFKLRIDLENEEVVGWKDL
tara:strand:+ start:681 stop:1322 length:642 start_codon:yes stop_codon:yes gene_type:complete